MSLTAATAAPSLADLLAMRLAMLRNGARSLTVGGWLKLAALGLLTLGFMVGEGMLAHTLIAAVKGKDDLAQEFVLRLLQRLLALVFLVCLSMLGFSNVTTAISTIYLSRDLDLLLATPVTAARVFALKVGETVVNSSYIIVLFVAPILVAWGWAFAAGPLFYLQIPLTLALFVIPPAALAILFTMILMRVLPARRTHQMLSAVGVTLAISLVTLLRLVAPERLLAPTATEDFMAILRALTIPGNAYLPSTWAADLQLAAVRGDWFTAATQFGLLLALAVITMGATIAAASRLYFRGVAASHEGGQRRRPVVGVPGRHLGFLAKEFRLFFRDPAQWTQLLLLGALIVIYVFNITALPTHLMLVSAYLITLRDLVAWINVGLAGFVLAAITMRFVLPSISIEGGAFWMIAAAPTRRSHYLLRKLAFYLPPLVAFGLILVALSGRALHVDPFTRNLGLLTIVVVTTTLTSLAIGLGAALPSFKLENPAQFVLTAGGILYGVLSLLYVVAVVALEAKPFFWHLLGVAGLMATGESDPTPYYVAIAVLSLVLAVVPLAWGKRTFDRLEM